MDKIQYDSIVKYLQRGMYPFDLKGDTSKKTNFRKLCRRYRLDSGKLYKDEKIVLREDDLVDEVQKWHVEGLGSGAQMWKPSTGDQSR